MSDALVTHAIPNDEIIGPVNGNPAIVAVPDRGTHHGSAAHGVPRQVVVQGISAQDAAFAQMAKLGLTDRSRGMTVIHRVPTHSPWLRRFDDDIAAQIRHLTTIRSISQMSVFEGTIERQARSVNTANDSFFRQRRAIVRSDAIA